MTEGPGALVKREGCYRWARKWDSEVEGGHRVEGGMGGGGVGGGVVSEVGQRG